MCTVTIFPTPSGDGFRLLANRDELHTRPPALPPERRSHAGVRCVYPVDPAGGGTWVGVNAQGVAATLLNLNPDPPAARRDDHQTRGRLVPLALEHATAQDAADALEQSTAPRDQLPFRLVIADRLGVYLLRSDGQTLTREDLGPPAGQWFTSSGLGDHVVQPTREAQYAAAFEGRTPAEGYAAQPGFHQQTDAADARRSVRMMRDDARTVSVTDVTVVPAGATLRYTPIDRDGRDGAAVEHRLPFEPTSIGPASRRRRVRGWHVYLFLLLASFVTQWFVTPWPGFDPGDTASLPAMGSHGVLPDRDPITLGYERITKGKTVFDWGPGPKPGKGPKSDKGPKSGNKNTKNASGKASGKSASGSDAAKKG